MRWVFQLREATRQFPAFSQTTRQFNYRVNATGVVTPSGDPFQIQIGLRYGF